MSIQLTKEQMQELGIAQYTAGEREAYYAKIGKVVFDTALLLLIETLNEEQLYALNHAIDSLDSFDSVLKYLENTYPGFTTLIEDSQNKVIDQIV